MYKTANYPHVSAKTFDFPYISSLCKTLTWLFPRFVDKYVANWLYTALPQAVNKVIHNNH